MEDIKKGNFIYRGDTKEVIFVEDPNGRWTVFNTPIHETKFRLGRKQERVILTQDGSREVCWFNRPFKHLAPTIVTMLNYIGERPFSQSVLSVIQTQDKEIEELKKFIQNISGEMLRSDFVLSEDWYEKAQLLIKDSE